jgi:alpha-methylacyl-CoA racemase
MRGPLAGIRIVEFASIGPGPFAAMMLADLGADVIRIERVHDAPDVPPTDPTLRGRRVVAVDLKQKAGVEVAKRLLETADGLIEGFRPGAMESLDLGPDEVLAVNPRIVYGRMTGWGQTGPLASSAGHDINYIGVAGVLAHIGTSGGPPVVPLNLVGDYGGGGMLLALGMLAGLLESAASGQGQVVDAAMVDGAALLMTPFHGIRASGSWNDERGANLLDGGAPFYSTYETNDGKYVAVGPIERRFYDQLAELAGFPEEMSRQRSDSERWTAHRAVMREIFLSKSLAEWREVFDGSDACVTPVLTMAEAVEHPHNRARGTFVEVDDVVQPAPAPRFSRTPGEIRRGPVGSGCDTGSVLAEVGFGDVEITALLDERVVQ